MTAIKAFGTWDAEKLEGNPFAIKGSLKVFMSEPKVPLIFDTLKERIGFICVRVASSNRFSLPKSDRTEEEKKRAVYYAVYTDASEWEIIDGGYSPVADSSAGELVRELISPIKEVTSDPVNAEVENVDQQALRDIIAQSPDSAPYECFPLTQRQMIEQAAYQQKMKVEEYIESQIPPKRRQWAYGRFGIDVRATA